MSDQFSRTLRSERIEPIDTAHTVKPTARIEKMRIERKKGLLDEEEADRGAPFSELAAPPDSVAWSMVIEAVEGFNNRQDMRQSPFAVRIWAQNTGFRIQIIREKCGTLIKQSPLMTFRDATREDLDHIINSLLHERGVLIDVMR